MYLSYKFNHFQGKKHAHHRLSKILITTIHLLEAFAELVKVHPHVLRFCLNVFLHSLLFAHLTSGFIQARLSVGWGGRYRLFGGAVL